MCDLPRSGLEPVSPALAGGFLTSAPPGKPPAFLKNINFFIYVWLHWVLVAACEIFVVAGGLLSSCGARAPEHVGSIVTACGLSSCRELGSVVVACVLSCPAACGILVPQPGIKPASPALEGGYLTTGPPGKS